MPILVKGNDVRGTKGNSHHGRLQMVQVSIFGSQEIKNSSYHLRQFVILNLQVFLFIYTFSALQCNEDFYGFVNIIFETQHFFSFKTYPDTVQCNLNLLVSDSLILTGEINKAAIISSRAQLG